MRGACGNMAKKQFKTVLFIDIPDPDNFLMAHHVLNSFSWPIAIVLSSRIVDFSVPRYEENVYAEMKESISIKTLITPIRDEIPDVEPQFKKWFYADSTLEDDEVLRDSKMYTKLSALRLMESLQNRGVKRTDFKIFWHEESFLKMPSPDMRHAFHVHDFKFNFNSEEMAKYRATQDNPERGNKLRTSLRETCGQYIRRQEAELALDENDDILTDLSALITANCQTEGAVLIIGGPLTEAWIYIKKTPEPSLVTMMNGTLKKTGNLFNDPFNTHKDKRAAKEFLECVVRESIPTQLVPTECIRSMDSQSTCPFTLRLSECETILGSNTLEYSMVEQWVEDTGKQRSYAPFDWITAVAASDPSIYSWIPVKLKTSSTTGDNGKTIVFSKTKKDTSLEIAQDDYKEMKIVKERLISSMKASFQTI
ncbi:hypothetical protein ACJQWK_11930 [Exserohilum turcicum]